MFGAFLFSMCMKMALKKRGPNPEARIRNTFRKNIVFLAQAQGA